MLAARAFRARDVLDAGLLTPAQLRSSAWQRLLPGVYCARAVAGRPEVRWEALRLVLGPADVACGRSAAWAHGVWRPRAGSTVPFEVSRPMRAAGTTIATAARRRLVLREHDGHVRTLGGPLALDDVVEVHGVRVTSPIRTCFDLMRERRLVEAVVVADAFAHDLAVPLPFLRAYCDDRRRWPGVRQARTASELASSRAMSPGETRLRMVVVLSGFPEPLVNIPVVDASGTLLGIPDLQLLGPRPARLEYDGAYHEDAGQHAADLRRENALTAAGGVPVLRYDRRHVGSGRALVVREVATVTGLRPTSDLQDGDFRRPPPARAW